MLPPCTLSNDCLANPAMQTVSGLPGGTSAPNTVITEYAMSKYHLQPSLNGWLIQAPAPLTATQISAARHLALAYEVTVETKSDAPSLGEFADGATALGIVIALGVLAASVGLIRSETARDLRTLTAAGASAGTRRMITAATAAALGLLGAILGMAGAVIAVLAWAHSSLSAMFGDVPLSRRADPAGRAAAGRRGRRLAAGRPRAGGHREAAAGLTRSCWPSPNSTNHARPGTPRTAEGAVLGGDVVACGLAELAIRRGGHDTAAAPSRPSVRCGGSGR